MTANNDLNKDEINWEDAYGDQCKLYKKTKKKLKKNRHKIKQLKKAKKPSFCMMALLMRMAAFILVTRLTRF